MPIIPEASVLDSLASEHRIWNVEVERSLLEGSMLSTIFCKRPCGFSEKAFFRNRSNKCPKCGSGLEVTSFNHRNAIVANKTEEFAFRLLEFAVKELRPKLEQKLFAKRGVICPELGLKGMSGADVAILSQDLNGRVPPSAIKCLFEVKMSFIWNWHEDDLTQPTADYDSHSGRPSIYRTDSILKAIGKAAITRSYVGSEGIPFVVIGNTPPPNGYRENVDGTVTSGLIQKWVSLTPKPLVVQPKDSPNKRNPKRTPGFLRIDRVEELHNLLETLLGRQWHYMSAMVDVQKIGYLIKSLELNCTPEEIGYQFLQRLPDASISTEI